MSLIGGSINDKNKTFILLLPAVHIQSDHNSIGFTKKKKISLSNNNKYFFLTRKKTLKKVIIEHKQNIILSFLRW